jgi:hypothetical protein
MDIPKFLQAALDELNKICGDKWYYIEDGDLMFKSKEELLTVCSVNWIDAVMVFKDCIVIANDRTDEIEIQLLPTGPEC